MPGAAGARRQRDRKHIASALSLVLRSAERKTSDRNKVPCCRRRKTTPAQVLIQMEISMTQMEQAQALLEEWVQSESLRKHCYSVSASMRYFAQLEGADVD